MSLAKVPSRVMASSLPVSWYFDPRILELEWERLFATGPNYVGHVSMVPEDRAWHVSQATGGGWLLLRDGSDYRLVSNVCAHRGGQMLAGNGRSKAIVCPLHLWTYDRCGRLTHAPHIDPLPEISLPTHSLQNWRGFLFRGPRCVARDLDEIGDWPDLGEGNWVFHRVDLDERDINWKIVTEVFLDNYHVKPYHASFRAFVDTTTLERGELTKLGERYSLQSARCAHDLQKHGSPVFRDWQEAILTITGGEIPTTSATWLYYYPNVIVEYYPFTMVVTTVRAIAAEKTVAVSEFYHRREALEIVPDWPRIEKAMTDEVSIEDDEIMISLHQGRRRLYESGRDGSGDLHPASETFQVYQLPMEEGLSRLHDTLRRTLSDVEMT